METAWRVSPMPWGTAPFQATKESSVVPSVWSLGVLYHKSAHSKAHHRASAALFFVGAHFIASGPRIYSIISAPGFAGASARTLTSVARGSWLGHRSLGQADEAGTQTRMRRKMSDGSAS